MSRPDGVLGVKRDDLHRIGLDAGRAVVLRRFRWLCARAPVRVSRICSFENSAVGRAAAVGTVTGIRREAEGAATFRWVCSREVFEERPVHSEKSSNKCTTSFRETRLALTPFAVLGIGGVEGGPHYKNCRRRCEGRSLRVIIKRSVRCLRSRPRRPAALPRR